LAEEVAAYREAEALVGDSPALAVQRLNAFRHRYPASPLAEEASLRLIQALLALGRVDEARAQARHFVVRYPRSAKRAELEALAATGDNR
jgi:outer membrane protein assembly factor BamD (BamD/ComL family)